MGAGHAHGSHRAGPADGVVVPRGPRAVLLGALGLSLLATIIGLVLLWPDGAEVDEVADRVNFAAPGVTLPTATVEEVQPVCTSQGRVEADCGNVVVTALTPDTVTEIGIPPLELFVTQKAIMGAVYGFASPRLQIPELLALYRTGDLKLRELITRTYRLDEINRGYADLEAGRNLRGVVVFEG